MIAAWEAFIAECSDGYSWDISEYRNELRVRNDIEVLVSSERLLRYDEHKEFCRAVYALDNEFTQLGHEKWQFPSGSDWWERLVPKKSGRELARYCRQVYGFAIEEVE